MNRGRLWLAVSIVIFAAVIVMAAQSVPTGSSLSFTGGTGACTTPAANVAALCSNGTTPVTMTVNGSAYASLVGPAGPAGAAGATGATGPIGPAGPQGPAGTGGTIQATITCTSLAVTSTGVVLTGCH